MTSLSCLPAPLHNLTDYKSDLIPGPQSRGDSSPWSWTNGRENGERESRRCPTLRRGHLRGPQGCSTAGRGPSGWTARGWTRLACIPPPSLLVSREAAHVFSVSYGLASQLLAPGWCLAQQVSHLAKTSAVLVLPTPPRGEKEPAQPTEAAGAWVPARPGRQTPSRPHSSAPSCSGTVCAITWYSGLPPPSHPGPGNTLNVQPAAWHMGVK